MPPRRTPPAPVVDGRAAPRPPSNRDPSRVPLGFEAHAGDKQFATTLARGLELLRCFTPREPQLGNAQLAARTGLPRSTIARLTYTLTITGHLRAGDRPASYRLGSTLLSTAYPVLAALTLRQAARGAMTALAEATGGSVSMGVRDRLDVVLVETARATAALRGSAADVGLTLPIAGSAIGRAWLAGCDAATRDAVLNAVRVKTPADWARYRPGLERALDDHARLGFCVVDGDLLPDVQAVAVAAGRGADGEPVAFNCTFQGRRLPAARLRESIGPRLVAMVRALRASEGLR
jgi:DNA-binding IclR family transcriptional regulator